MLSNEPRAYIDGDTYVMDKAETGSTREHISTHKVAPTEATNKSREDEAAGKNESAVPAVLPPDDLVLAQVADVSDTRAAARLNQHPANVGPPKAEMGIVRVESGVGVAVVCAVATRPPLDRALDGTRAGDREEILEGLRGVVRAVGPEPVVARGDPCRQ